MTIALSIDICRFAGIVIDTDGPLLIANCQESLQKTRDNNPGIETFTSLGVHDEQLTHAELFAYISVEICSNLNFMAEARKRSRPQNAFPAAAIRDLDADDHN